MVAFPFVVQCPLGRRWCGRAMPPGLRMAMLPCLVLFGLLLSACNASWGVGTHASASANILSGQIQWILEEDDQCKTLSLASPAESCALDALQRRARKRVSVATEAEEGCHTIEEGENGTCWRAIQWARHEGFGAHPEWYSGMDPATSPLSDWQMKAWNQTHPKCPRPCDISTRTKTKWCSGSAPPSFWKPNAPNEEVWVQVLSYNLYWWNLFKKHGGRFAVKLVEKAGKPHALDAIGFQECEDPNVPALMELRPTYTIIHDERSLCMAFKTRTWSLMSKGAEDVAEDMRTEYFGKRAVQWMRLQHKKTGLGLLFTNHHGPLPVNSGGDCGGVATANNIMRVMQENAREGDLLVLVGDFNANAASKTIQSFWPHLYQAYNSPSLGGVDNIFSNIESSQIESCTDLGTGGSDHHAIKVVMKVGAQSVNTSRVEDSGMQHAVASIQKAMGADGCLIEADAVYSFSENAWNHSVTQVIDPKTCCKICQGHSECNAWSWSEWEPAAKAPICVMSGGMPSAVTSKAGTASGLPKARAMRAAEAAIPK
eukprot:TRINITY_DN59397_c0_g1_i1.p1 TRINITY_DN59397_c0_g1~~TRINITY_DN59397_c0_g1_i1.p1  ORF type:complete len:542 (-),score=76.35 TRINITY_DN59397_c0_g1_i1:49-1674(-)